MIDPRRVLRALAEHWALLEPLCERFDAGTLSLAELRSQLNTQLPESNPAEITALLDQWIRLDILVPVAKSPNRFELNAQIHDFLAYLRHEHRLGLCLEIEAYLRHLERLAGYIQDAFETRDSQDLARQLRLLDMRVRDVLKKLGNDEQALIGVAERAKTSDRQIPLAQRYAEVLATWDEYVEPMIQLVSADGAFEQGVRRVEQVLLRLLGEQQRLGHLVDDDLVLRTHARILEMQTNAQLTLRRARELLLPLREEARRHNAVTRGAALALAAIRRKGLDAVPQAAMPLFTRPQSTFLGTASQVESYVFALARFEPKPAQFPKFQRHAQEQRAGATTTDRAGNDRALPGGAAAAGPHAMAAGPGTGRRHRRVALLVLPAVARRALPARTPATPRVRNHRTLRQPLLLRPEPRRQGQGPGQGRRHPFRERNPCILISPN